VNILGIWDGHDAGAALIVDNTVVAAINEERLTRRKLEVSFPLNAIRACCDLGGIRRDQVDIVACSTSDVAKTLARVFPSTKEAYYRIRRRKAAPSRLAGWQKQAKYRITEWPSNRVTRALSASLLRRAARAAGLTNAAVRLYDHHECHAAAAAEASGFDECAVLTIDGVGDGLSATVSTFSSGVLHRISETPARDSLGIFFEHVTNLLNMRELEDEGKVMALADYASPVPDSENPLLELIDVVDLRFALPIAGHALARRLRELLWYYPNEQFAAMAQRTVEHACVRLARNVVRDTGLHHLALAGGVASNVKANRRIRLLEEVSDVFVFPHMGDGGLALGAAILAARENGVKVDVAADDLGWGMSWTDDEIRAVLDPLGIPYLRCAHIPSAVADLLQQRHIVLWFQGRMEYGPRALGHRSVLARPDLPELRDRLNLVLKRRVWYQPFCPSILERDAHTVLADWKGTPNRHMTMAYMVRESHRASLAGVMNIDGSCRPQIVREEADGPFAALLREMRTRSGLGALLNTSFNIHGEPLVCTPGQALQVFEASGADALAIGSFLIRRQGRSA
jgi:carbamoyltransferase